MDKRGPAASPEENKSSGFFGGLRRGFLAKPSGSDLPVDRTEGRASTGPRKGFLLSSKNEENGATEKKKDEGGGGRHTTENSSPPHKSSKVYNKYFADNPPFTPSGLVSEGTPAFTCGVCRGVVYINRAYHYQVFCLENCTTELHSECLTILLRRQNIGSIDELKIASELKFKIDLRCFNPRCSAPLVAITELYLSCVDGYVHTAFIYSLFDLDTVPGELSKPEPKKHFDEKNVARRARDEVKTFPKKTSEVSTTSKTASDPSDNLNGDGKGIRCMYSMDERRPAASPEDNNSSGFPGGLRRDFLARRSESEVPVDSEENRASKGLRSGAAEKKKDEGGGGQRTTERTSPLRESSKVNNKCSADNPHFSPSGPGSEGIPAFTCGDCRGVVYINSSYHYKVLCSENCTMELHSQCLAKLLRRQNIGSIDDVKTAFLLKSKIRIGPRTRKFYDLRCFNPRCAAPILVILEDYLDCVSGHVHSAPAYSAVDWDMVEAGLWGNKAGPKKRFDENNIARRARDDVKTSPKKTSEVSTASKVRIDPSDNSNGDEKGIRWMYSMDERRPAASPEDNNSSGILGGLPRDFLAKRSESEVPVDEKEDGASKGLRKGFLLSSMNGRSGATEKKKAEGGGGRRTTKKASPPHKTSKVNNKCSADNPFPPSGLESEGIPASTCVDCRGVVYINSSYHYKSCCWEECRMYLHSECLTKLLRRQNIDSIDQLKMACVGKHKIALPCFNPCCHGIVVAIAEHHLNSVDGSAHSAPVYSLFDFDPAAGELSSDEVKPKKHYDEKNKSRRAREAVETSPKKTSKVSTASKISSDPNDNFNRHGKEKKPCLTNPCEPPGPNGAVQAEESKSTMYNVEELLEPSPAASAENPSEAGLEGLRCLYSMDERRAAASPEENKSSSFFGGLRRGFLAKRSGSEVPVDSKEDRTSKGLRSGAAEKKKDEGGGGQRTTERTSPLHESSKVNNKCSAENPHFSPSGAGSEGIPVFTCGVCRGVVYMNSSYHYKVLCVKECTMYLHGECLSKLLSRHNIGSIGDLKIASVLKFKIDLRCFNPRCPAPLLVILEDYLNCVSGHVYSMPIYSLLDLDWVAGQMSKDIAEAKKHFDERNIARRAGDDVKTSPKKTSEVPTASKIPSDPRNNLNGDGKEKKPCPTHAPGPPAPNEAVQAKETKPTMYTKEKLPEPSPAASVENPRKAGLKGKGKKRGHLKTPDGTVQVKESKPTMYTVEKLPELSPAAPEENPREAGKGKKQGHLKAPDGAVQVKESEQTMYTLDNFPEVPKAQPVEGPPGVSSEGEYPKEEKENLYEADELRSVATPVLSLSPDLSAVEQPTQGDEERVVEKYSVVSDPPKRNSKRARKKRNERVLPVDFSDKTKLLVGNMSYRIEPNVPEKRPATTSTSNSRVRNFSASDLYLHSNENVENASLPHESESADVYNEEHIQPNLIFKDDREMVEVVVDGVKPLSRDLLLNTLHCAQPVERLRETIEMVMGRAYEPYRNLIDKIFNSEDLLRDFIGKLRIFIVSRERGRIIFSKSMYGRAMENQLNVSNTPPTIPTLSSPFCADGAGIERSDQLKDELTKPKNPSIKGSLSRTCGKPFASSNRPIPKSPWKNVLDGAKTRSVTVEDRDCQVCLERFTSNGRVLMCPHKGCEEPYHEMCVRPWLMEQAKCPQCRRSWPDPVSFPQMGSF